MNASVLLAVIGASEADTSSLPLTAGVAVALLICSAFFSGSETALFSLQPVERETMRQRPGLGGRITRLLEHPPRTLAALLMGNELVNVSLSAVCAGAILSLAPDLPWLNLVVATPLLIVFGEVLPKTVALKNAARWTSVIARPLSLWAWVTTPARAVLGVLARTVIRRFGAEESNGHGGLREEAFRDLIDEGLEGGTIRPVEQEIIHRVFEFGELPVARLMTPRPDMVCAPIHLSYDQLLELVRQHGYSRIPIYAGRPDDIVGVLLAKELLRFRGQSVPGIRQIRSILRDPYFVPTTKPADELLREFQQQRMHLALVVDEHGSIVGLITLDDLLGELVGELGDDDDDSDEIERTQPDVWTVSGAMDVEDFAEETGITLPDGDYHTVAGFVLSLLGHVPEEGEEVVFDGLAFQVESVEDRRVCELTVRPRPQLLKAEP